MITDVQFPYCLFLLCAELPVSSNMENLIFPSPPRITIKLKIKSKTSSKSGNGPLCPDNSSNVYDVSGAGMGQGKPPLQHSRAPRDERTNGIVPITKPTGKPLALHAALHAHVAKPEQDRPHQHSLKPKGIMEKPAVQRNVSCLTTPPEPGSCDKHSGKGQPGALHKSTMEHFSRTLKKATVSLVRTTADLWSANKNHQKNKERTNCGKAPSTERAPKSVRGYQESDGYCPDLELSDSEPEAKGRRQRERERVGRGLSERSSAAGYGRGGARGNVAVGSRTSVQR
ncbi:protein Jade-3 [Tachysurus ichikawai]